MFLDYNQSSSTWLTSALKAWYDIVSWKGVSSECLETSGACFSCHNIWRRVPQASSGQDPGMLNLLECIEYFCTMRNCPTGDVSHSHAPMEQYWKEQNACKKGRGRGGADEVRLLSFLSTVVWGWSWACRGTTNKAKAGGSLVIEERKMKQMGITDVPNSKRQWNLS